MKQIDIISAFAQLGKLMRALGENKEWSDFSLGLTEDEYIEFNVLIRSQFHSNGWFTEENTRKSLFALGSQLTEPSLSDWLDSYKIAAKPKKIGIIMAGNIPLVGFHDFLCVLCSGNYALCKLSSADKYLLPALSKFLVQFLPALKDNIEFTEARMTGLEAVIATGSDNSLQYFEQYFGKYPHIFRKNRTSIAVLNGTETEEELISLGDDVFNYFGLGCRNVSHLLLPMGYDIDLFFGSIIGHSRVIENNKYANNYDYNKAVFLMNLHDLLDNNFVLLRESEELFSPLSMIHYHYYSSVKEIEDYIQTHKEDIQVVVGEEYVSFGDAQRPSLEDYADGVNVLDWLSNL